MHPKHCQDFLRYPTTSRNALRCYQGAPKFSKKTHQHVAKPHSLHINDFPSFWPLIGLGGMREAETISNIVLILTVSILFLCTEWDLQDTSARK